MTAMIERNRNDPAFAAHDGRGPGSFLSWTALLPALPARLCAIESRRFQARRLQRRRPEIDVQQIRLGVACGLIGVVMTVSMAATAVAADDAAQYVQFVEEPAALCVERNGVQIQVKSSHPSRTLRVWLDRIHMGVGTGDRSRSDLPPGGDPQPLGCSRSLNGPQEWRVVKAEFVE
jgi:hypothetical protein